MIVGWVNSSKPIQLTSKNAVRITNEVREARRLLDLLRRFSDCKLIYTSREANRVADVLASKKLEDRTTNAILASLNLGLMVDKVGAWFLKKGQIKAPFAKKHKEVVVKDVASLLKDKDIGLSNIDSERKEIKEASGSSENVPAVGLVNPRGYPSSFNSWSSNQHVRKFGLPAVDSVNPHGYLSSFNPWSSNHVRTFSGCAFFMHQKNLFQGEKTSMRRSMQPSNSSNVLAFLAMSFRRGLRRL